LSKFAQFEFLHVRVARSCQLGQVERPRLCCWDIWNRAAVQRHQQTAHAVHDVAERVG
jgi:hypothetical protein